MANKIAINGVRMARGLLKRVVAHADREGREDYEARAADVAAGLGDPSWAWPFISADEAYITAIGTSQICSDLELDHSDWDRIGDVWCAAFERGYKAAHESEVASAAETVTLTANLDEASAPLLVPSDAKKEIQIL